MNEQISIDEEFVEKVIDAVGMSPVAWDCVDPRELCRSVIDVYLDSNEEIKRLNRLDENVKAKIQGFESMKGGFNRLHDIYRVAEDRIKLLESLYRCLKAPND